MTQAPLHARARARANIALAKYWGKSDETLNLPAVPSISMTLDPLVTETTVEFREGLASDEFVLNDARALAVEDKRVTALLDRVRAESGVALHARVASKNHFPTASRLGFERLGFCCARRGRARGGGSAVRCRQGLGAGAPVVGVGRALGVRRLRRAARRRSPATPRSPRTWCSHPSTWRSRSWSRSRPRAASRSARPTA